MFSTHLRLDGLFFGTALAYLYRFHSLSFTTRARTWRWALIGTGLTLLAPAFALEITSPTVRTIGFTIFYLGAGALMVGVMLCELPHGGIVGRILKTIAKLGSYSYSVYLWHMPFLMWGVPLVQQAVGKPLGFLGAVSVYVIGSFAWGILMAKCIELPAIKLRDRWFPARTTSPVLPTRAMN